MKYNPHHQFQYGRKWKVIATGEIITEKEKYTIRGKEYIMPKEKALVKGSFGFPIEELKPLPSNHIEELAL